MPIGLPIVRAIVLVDTLHPIYESRLFRWERDPTEAAALVEFDRTVDTEARHGQWRRSPFFHLLETGGMELRRNLARGDPADFAMIQDLRDLGHTDYLALVNRFAASER